MSGHQTLYLIIIVFCLFASAFFSSAETAIVSLSKLRVKHMVSQGKKWAELLEKFQAAPSFFLSTILLGNTLVNITAATMSTVLSVSILGETLGALVATIAITILVLVFGEVLPKTFAIHNAERMALIYAIPVQIVMWVLYPFVWLLSKIGGMVTHIVTEDEEKMTVDEEEIRTAIDVGEAEGVWEEAEADMIHKAFEFPDRPVRDVMQPRTDTAFIPAGTTLDEFLEIYREHPHSRFPVYRETSDNVIGILTVKDVLMAMAKDSMKNADVIDSLIRSPYFVPESKKLGELLPEMRDHNYHIAIIIDEYGGVAGIANLEHLAAEIMGSIGDEMTSAEKEIVSIDANTYNIDGAIRLEEANAELDLDLPEGDYDTVAGFILSHLGRIPQQGEHFKYHDLKIAISEMRDKKIERIIITKEKHVSSAS